MHTARVVRCSPEIRVLRLHLNDGGVKPILARRNETKPYLFDQRVNEIRLGHVGSLSLRREELLDAIYIKGNIIPHDALARISSHALFRSCSAPPCPSTVLFSEARRPRYGNTSESAPYGRYLNTSDCLKEKNKLSNSLHHKRCI